MALLIWGGKVLVISTHFGESNYFNKLIEDARGGRNTYHIESCDFDQALHDGLYQRVCLRTGETWSPEAEAAWRAGIIADYGEAADEELFCIPSKGGGVYFPRPLIQARMSNDRRVISLERTAEFTYLPKEQREADIDAWCKQNLEDELKALDQDRQHAFGQDFGRKSDLSVISPIEIGKTLKCTVPFQVEMANIPFEQQKQVLFYICDRLPRFVGGKMDATGNGAYLAEVAAQKYGVLRVEQVKLNEGWYLENFPPLKRAFEDSYITIPAGADQLDDFAIVQKIRGVPRVPDVRTTGADGKKRHGDSVISVVLAYAQTRGQLVEFGYRGVEPDPVRPTLDTADEADASGERGWWEGPLGASLRGGI